MRMVDIITRKRDGKELSQEEIKFFIQHYVAGGIPDYQAAALCMAIYFRGMTHQETTYLTHAMAFSGETLDLHNVAAFVVDKHSSGGVGDKTTLVVAPVVAALGQPVGKMSGRGLSFTGGTLDKLESIPGFTSELSVQKFKAQLADIGVVVAGQTRSLAPADGKLYALRDVTGTVPAIPLIASSIMSKKIAAGADAIILDVKVGEGAFLANLDNARELSQVMMSIGKNLGRKMFAIISDMNQPLGSAVGNALEVKEAIATLHGGGPADFREHVEVISAYMLLAAGKVQSEKEGRQSVCRAIADGSAWAKFRQFVAAQGGDLAYVDQPERLPVAAIQEDFPAPASGYVHRIAAKEIGLASTVLGGGREEMEDKIDPAVGVVVHHKVGDRVIAGEPLLTLHANDPVRLSQALELVDSACTIAPQPVEPLPIIYEVLC